MSEWAQFNNLRLNTTKSVELIIHRPGVKLDKLSVPPPTLGLTRKTTTKILGVTITDTLSFSPHITDVIARCSQTSYALRILRAHGLNGPALWNVTRSTFNQSINQSINIILIKTEQKQLNNNYVHK